MTRSGDLWEVLSRADAGSTAHGGGAVLDVGRVYEESDVLTVDLSEASKLKILSTPSTPTTRDD